MPQRSEMLWSILTPWIMAATICAALPFLRAAQSLQTALDGFLPLIIALVIGIAAGVGVTSLGAGSAASKGRGGLIGDS